MNESKELEILASAWQAESPSLPVDLERMVRRQGLWIVLNAACGVLVSIAFLGGSLWWAIAHPEPEFVALAVGIWMITLATVIYSFANQAGTWSPAAEDTRAFLALSLKRCRAGLRGIRFGFYLLAIEVILLAAWHAWYWSSHAPVPPLKNWLVAACLPLAFAAVLTGLRIRKLRELARLEMLERQIIG